MITVGYNGFTDGADTFARLDNATGIDKHCLIGHDAAASIFVDGELVAAVEEERLNRVKKTSTFPRFSLQWCLEKAGVAIEDVDTFAIPWKFSPSVLEAILQEVANISAPPEVKLEQLYRWRELTTRLVSPSAIHRDFVEATGFDIDPSKITLVPHHLAHLMCGYYMSGNRDSAFLISDGSAEHLSSIMGEIVGGKVRIFEGSGVRTLNSLAILFGKITRYLGFMPNNDEYKVMGLAAYHPEQQSNALTEQILQLGDNGTYELSLTGSPIVFLPFDILYQVFDQIFDGSPEIRHSFDFRVKVAAMAQQMIEVATAHQIRWLESQSSAGHLIFEGGLALNCVNNSKILEESHFEDVSVSFGASDPGVSIGAAAYHVLNKYPASEARRTPYLGPSFPNHSIRAALLNRVDEVTYREISPAVLPIEVASILSEKVVVGWFQGCTEYGPRALGNRSILANPSFADIKDIINLRVKHREPFRPFAPVVLESNAQEVFDMGKKETSPYMTFTFPVRAEYREIVPGACHVDGTARVQTVNHEQNYELSRLLEEFTELTGVPCLLNTSFNVAGEPIVSSPQDALDCFLKTDIDVLVLGCFIVEKK